MLYWVSNASEWVSFTLLVSRPDVGPIFFKRNAGGREQKGEDNKWDGKKNNATGTRKEGW